MAERARQLALSMNSPVWEAVRRPAPWAQGKRDEALAARRELLAVQRRMRITSYNVC